MKKRGKVCRFEPVNLKCEEEMPRCTKRFKDAGWYSFFERIMGYNIEVTHSFAHNFSDPSINFQTLTFKLIEILITEATRFPVEWDRLFKKYPFEASLGLYLLPGFEYLDWSKGIHLNNVKQ